MTIDNTMNPIGLCPPGWHVPNHCGKAASLVCRLREPFFVQVPNARLGNGPASSHASLALRICRL